MYCEVGNGNEYGVEIMGVVKDGVGDGIGMKDGELIGKSREELKNVG